MYWLTLGKLKVLETIGMYGRYMSVHTWKVPILKLRKCQQYYGFEIAHAYGELKSSLDSQISIRCTCQNDFLFCSNKNKQENYTLSVNFFGSKLSKRCSIVVSNLKIRYALKSYFMNWSRYLFKDIIKNIVINLWWFCIIIWLYPSLRVLNLVTVKRASFSDLYELKVWPTSRVVYFIQH